RVPDTGEDLPFLRREVVGVEDVAPRPQQRECGGDDREVEEGHPGGAAAPRRDEAAVDVMGEERGEQRRDEGDREEADDEVPPREREEVVTDVAPELRVGRARR